MLAERELRNVRALKSEARLALGQVKWLSVGAWRIGVSCMIHDGEIVQWAFSAQLLDRTHSTEQDWAALGQLITAVGAPFDPVTPIAQTKPTDVHHWAWVDGPDGPIHLTLQPELVETIREAVRKRPKPS